MYKYMYIHVFNSTSSDPWLGADGALQELGLGPCEGAWSAGLGGERRGQEL